ncbi:perilipin-2-like isoform X2 [Artemia franciscana]|uniref:perilipin-2-like isoform X2 n=1 Tax=Artemia franciscana TaxID=6661 RepID=UPI0032DB9DF0
MYRKARRRVVDREMVQSAESRDRTPLEVLSSNVEFFQKVSKLPVVNSAISYASEAYGKAKESSPYIIQRTISTAEGTVKYAAEKTMPLALPVVTSMPVHMVDSIACKTLDKFEEKMPVVTKTPEEIIQTTKDYVNGKLQPTYDRVEAVKSTVTVATERVLTSSVGQMALGGVLTALDTADNCVEYFLPGKDKLDDKGQVSSNGAGEMKQPPMDSGNERLSYSLNRSVNIVQKARKRFSNALGTSIYNIRITAKQLFDSLGINLEMLTYLRETASSALSMRRLSELYEQLTNEKLPEDANTDDIKGRSLRLARVLTRRLLTTTQRAMGIIQALPGLSFQAVRDQIDVVAVFVAETGAQFMKATNLERISSEVLVNVRTKLPVVYGAFVTALDLTTSSLVFLFPGLRESIQGSSEGIKIRIEEVARDKEQHQQKDVPKSSEQNTFSETSPRRRRPDTRNENNSENVEQSG